MRSMAQTTLILLKGIPDGFARTVKRDGFAMSEPLIGLDGNRRVLFGNALSGNRILYASLPADSMQKACGETTYLGEGYSYILGRDGRGVIPPVRYSYEQVYVNIRHLQAESIPVIAMTANVFAEDVLAAKAAGMDAHIGKPIDIGHLMELLQRWLA